MCRVQFFYTLFYGSTILAATLLSAGCSSQLIVKHDYDNSVNFRQYSNYNWMDTAGSDGVNDLNDTRIRNAVERDLASKGYFKTTGGDPELLVTYELIITDKEDVITHNYGYWRGARSETYVDVSVYREGTLVVDIVNPAQNRVIFRGWATGVVQGELSPEQSEALINRAVSKILGKFPPN
ncbi:MAG: DUF4136 domain-containing protein [bacterium]|nr:DUF4136 domain-containing protein [bacterium]